MVGPASYTEQELLGFSVRSEINVASEEIFMRWTE
jgi:hypothetical protein